MSGRLVMAMRGISSNGQLVTRWKVERLQRRVVLKAAQVLLNSGL